MDGGPAAALRSARPSWAIRALDGTEFVIRRTASEDGPALGRFYAGLSAESRRLRFFSSPAQPVDSLLARQLDAGGLGARAFVAGPRGSIEVVALGEYVPVGAEEAEVAFVVADAVQGLGLATQLLLRMAAEARKEGIRRFTAEVLGENHRMLEVFAHSGFAMETRPRAIAVVVSLRLAPRRGGPADPVRPAGTGRNGGEGPGGGRHAAA